MHIRKEVAHQKKKEQHKKVKRDWEMLYAFRFLWKANS